MSGHKIFYLEETNTAASGTALSNAGEGSTLLISSPLPPATNSAVAAIAHLGPGVWSFSYEGEGILGMSHTNASSKNGVRGQASMSGVSGVYGENTAKNGGFGVTGRSSETGVLGESTGGIIGEGVRGVGVRGVGQGSAYGVYGSTTSGIGVIGVSSGKDGRGVYAYGERGLVASGTRQAGVFVGNVLIQDGNLTVTGSKSAAVPHPDGSRRQLYVLESPESWFEDFGEAQLENGMAEVGIDTDFAAIVHTDDYKVFLTPYGDCEGLYVSDRRHSGFSVRELQNGRSKISFGYRVVARRKDIQVERLARVEIPERPEFRDPSKLSPPPSQPEPIAAPDLQPGAASQTSP